MPLGAGCQEKLYICPGETRPISRSVHLSRLAAFFPACRDCPFRTDTGQLSKGTIERLQLTEHRVERKSLLTAEGVRGVYINELTRSKAGRMAAALARLLWQESPLIGRGPADHPPGGAPSPCQGASPCHGATGEPGHRPRRPAVVVGHDERPSSPDVVSGVAASLRRMGCQVIDISLTTRPCFWFAVDHLQADAGVFVTGAGSPPSWTGLDFAGRQGMPLSGATWGAHDPGLRKDFSPGHPPGAQLDLNRIEEQARRPFSRSTRHAGPYRTFQAAVPYEAGLWKHFHALRPLTVACACPNRLTRRTLGRIFDTLPCRLNLVDVPHRVRNPLDPADADVHRVRTAVGEQQAHFGVLIDDDGQCCGFVDETGRLVPFERVAQLVFRLMLAEHPGETAVIETPALEAARPIVERAGGSVVDGGETFAQMAGAMRAHAALVGGGRSGRLWFRETFPTSDAILTLAKVLALLSRSDAPLSQVAGSV